MTSRAGHVMISLDITRAAKTAPKYANLVGMVHFVIKVSYTGIIWDVLLAVFLLHYVLDYSSLTII